LSQPEIPPWLREQLARLEQLQQNLQTITLQKQQVEAELSEVDKALEELNKSPESDQIYKYAGSLLLRVKRDAILKELDERKEVANTRNLVLTKQENRFKESVRELQTKIEDALRGKTAQQQQPTPKSDQSN
jgi:prefoldin beta subunit